MTNKPTDSPNDPNFFRPPGKGSSNTFLDGKTIEHRTLTPFQKLVLKGSTDVIYRRSDTLKLIVAGDSGEDVATVTTEVVNGKLKIEREGVTVRTSSGGTMVFHGSVGEVIAGRNINIHGSVFNMGRRTLTAGRDINVRQVIYGDATGMVAGRDINIQQVTHGDTSTKAKFPLRGNVIVCIAAPELPELSIKGSGDVTLIDLSQPSLQIKIAGSGDVHASGQVKELDISIQGSGDVDARELISDRASLRIAGAGDIEAFVREEVTARIAGAGDITIRGNPPQRHDQVLGAGKIKFR